MTPREAVQVDLRDFLIDDLKLTDSYGVIESENKKYRGLTFCKAAVLDGVIEIYGPKFILVRWTTSIRRMPYRGSEKFESVEATKEFLKENFYYESA